MAATDMTNAKMGEEGADFRRLKVYQEAFELALAVYNRVRGFPVKEGGELTAQLRRSALSAVTNVAEGYGRRVSQKDFAHFINIAIGSVNETMVLLEFAQCLGYFRESERIVFDKRYTLLVKRLKSLYKRLRSNR